MVKQDKVERIGEDKGISLTNQDKRKILETFVENDDALG